MDKLNWRSSANVSNAIWQSPGFPLTKIGSMAKDIDIDIAKNIHRECCLRDKSHEWHETRAAYRRNLQMQIYLALKS